MFKGGTSLRKCRLGTYGRFSTDLDFAAPDEAKILAVCEAIDGADVSGFQYRLHSPSDNGRHWEMTVTHSELGSPRLAASVEFAKRPLYLPAEQLGFVTLPIHRAYPFPLPALPVIAEEEACAEKLARCRRTAPGRDVYDLAQFAKQTFDEALLRRLWVLKVWGDVVDDRRGDRPLDPAQVLTFKCERDFQPDSIGMLTQPIDVPGWERTVRQRFAFLADLDADEQRWAACNPRERYEVEAAVAGLGR